VERAVFVADLERLPAPQEPYDRLYLGSEFCIWRLPHERELRESLAAANRRGMSFSLVTPFLDEPGLARALALALCLPEDRSSEVVANDLGLIEALRAAGWRGTVVAGRLLTRQRRGPGFQSFGEITPAAGAALQGSALDSPAYVELLGSVYGVKRFELDDLVQGVSVPSLPAGVSLSLYRPYLLVTATRNCPWIFDGRTWDRAHGCARPCRGQTLCMAPVQASGSCRCGPPSCSLRSAAGDLPSAPPLRQPHDGNSYHLGSGAVSSETDAAEGWREAGAPGGAQRLASTDGGAQRQDPAACTGTAHSLERNLILGGCAQFLEHRSEAPPPAGVDRIVWQPEAPA
jgi:hypothetical protein